MADSYEGIYDESDWESDFEDLEYDEARRRGRRGRRGRGGRRGRTGVRTSGRTWQPQRPPAAGGTTAATLSREAAAGRARDRQLASAVNTTREDVGDIEGQLRKVNGDLSRLRQISMISLLLPPTFARQRLTIAAPATEGGLPVLTTVQNPTGTPATGQVDVVSGSQLNILPVVLFMTMARGIGMPGRAGSSASGAGGDMMMPLLLVLLAGGGLQTGSTGGTGTGGLDSTALLLVLMASGGLS